MTATSGTTKNLSSQQTIDHATHRPRYTMDHVTQAATWSVVVRAYPAHTMAGATAVLSPGTTPAPHDATIPPPSAFCIHAISTVVR